MVSARIVMFSCAAGATAQWYFDYSNPGHVPSPSEFLLSLSVAIVAWLVAHAAARRFGGVRP